MVLHAKTNSRSVFCSFQRSAFSGGRGRRELAGDTKAPNMSTMIAHKPSPRECATDAVELLLQSEADVGSRRRRWLDVCSWTIRFSIIETLLLGNSQMTFIDLVCFILLFGLVFCLLGLYSANTADTNTIDDNSDRTYNKRMKRNYQ